MTVDERRIIEEFGVIIEREGKTRIAATEEELKEEIGVIADARLALLGSDKMGKEFADALSRLHRQKRRMLDALSALHNPDPRPKVESDD